MGFDEMLTSATACVGAHCTHGRGVAPGYDHPRRPHLLLGEEDGAHPSPRQKLLATRVGLERAPPPICGDGVEEGAGLWACNSRKRKKQERSLEPEEGQGFRTEESVMGAREVAVGSPRRPVCSGCGTSRTPMWRSGPAGPKTLCNACGIRYRKKRRSGGSSSSTAPAASAGEYQQKGEAAAAEAQVRNKGEKLRRRQRRRREVLGMLLRESTRFAYRCGEEEAEAAVLLMAISSGLFVHTSH